MPPQGVVLADVSDDFVAPEPEADDVDEVVDEPESPFDAEPEDVDDAVDDVELEVDLPRLSVL